MATIKSRRKIIILIVLIALILFGIYIWKSSSKSFKILDVNKVSNINDPALRIAIKAAEKCDEIDSDYQGACYVGVIVWLSFNYGGTVCNSLKNDLKRACFLGYGKNIGEKYGNDAEAVKSECSKTDQPINCMTLASRAVGERLHPEADQCEKFQQEETKQYCYTGMGIRLARNKEDLKLCKRTKDEEACLLGYAFVLYSEGGKEKALQICNQTSKKYAYRCYFLIGVASANYGKDVAEAFEGCLSLPYPEACKEGAAQGAGLRFFKEEQKRSSV